MSDTMSTILIFDNDTEFDLSLESLFSSYQTKVLIARDKESIIEQTGREHPDLVILDMDLLGREGFELCRLLKSKWKTQRIPIIALSSEHPDFDARRICIEAGCDDCMIKPCNAREVVSRAQTIIRKFEVRDKMKTREKDKTEVRNKLSQEIEKFHQINRGFEETAEIDRLTGLCNKSYFKKRLREEFHHALRHETAISLVTIDIDSFGRINESFGHDVGDYILMQIANVLLVNSRVADIVGRMDGANFAVIMPHTDAQSGVFEAERLRIAINQTDYIDQTLMAEKENRLRKQKSKIILTASLGVASYPADDPIKNENELINRAKKALDRAKTTGKNKTVSIVELL